MTLSKLRIRFFFSFAGRRMVHHFAEDSHIQCQKRFLIYYYWVHTTQNDTFVTVLRLPKEKSRLLCCTCKHTVARYCQGRGVGDLDSAAI